MCDISDDEQCSVWSETTPIARKSHRCDGCGGPIAKGERYRRVFFAVDGHASTEKECAACSTVAAEYLAVNGMRWTPSQMRLALTDCVDYEGEDSEDGQRWAAAIEAMDLRRAAVRESAEVITEER